MVAKGSYLFSSVAEDVQEYLVDGVMSLYKGCKTAASVAVSFPLKAGVRQGSALSPFLFIMLMDILTEDARDGSLMELFYADHLALCEEPLNEIMDKYGR